jgi:hypothetical protein
MAIKQETIDKLNSAIENLQTLKESISMLPEEKAGGIESYFTSPLALREQYRKETGKHFDKQPKHCEGCSFKIMSDYAKWLESILCNLKGLVTNNSLTEPVISASGCELK